MVESIRFWKEPRAMRKFQASTWREGGLVVAQCLEIDVASQGGTTEDALANLREALELFFETASPSEVMRRRGIPREVFES